MLFVFALIMMLTVAAFFNYGRQESDDLTAQRMGNPAREFVTYHAAAVRFCSSSPTACPGINAGVARPDVNANLPTFSQGLGGFADGSFSSLKVNGYLVTYFTGRSRGGSREESRAGVLNALYTELPIDTGSAVGVYDGTGFRPRGFVYEVGFSAGQGGKKTGQGYHVIPFSMVGVPVGSPMILTKLLN